MTHYFTIEDSKALSLSILSISFIANLWNYLGKIWGMYILVAPGFNHFVGTMTGILSMFLLIKRLMSKNPKE